jgi:hypothetical protein
MTSSVSCTALHGALIMNKLDLPSGVGEKTVSMFANASDTKPEDTNIGTLLEAIHNGQDEIQINRLRNLLQEGKKDEYNRDKKKLPAFTTSGKFSKRNAKGLLDHSGIIQIDIDKVVNPAELRDKLIQDKHICAAFISPSGKGVKCLMLTLADPTKHKAAFNTAENYLKDHYNVEIDKACKDVSRLCFVSYDADLRTNPDAITLPIPEEPQKNTQQKKRFTKQSDNETVNRLRSALQVLSAEEYGTWISHGIALKNWNGNGAFEIWHSWSKTASNYKDQADCFDKWQSFEPRSGIDESAIFRAATDAGWSLPRESTNPESMSISLADSGLEERQKREMNVWKKPQEITAELLPVEELTPEMIPEPLRDWLTDIAHRMQVPLDFSATACVVMLSSIIGTRLSIRPKKNDSWQVIPNLWGALIQRPSQLKSPPVQEVFKVLDKLEAESFKQNEDAEKTYQNENRKFEMKQKIYEDNLRKAMKKGEDLEVGSAENELEILESEPPDKPTTRRYQTQDATPEKLQDLLSVNPQGILVFRDELNGFLMSLEKEGHETARAFYLEGWNGGGSFTLDRISRGTVRSNLICISLFGTIQPAKIIPHIRKAKSETGNDGLFQRFQIAVYPDAVKWSYIDKIPNQSAHSRAFKLIRRLTEMNFGEHDSVQNEGDGIPFMKFSAEAQDLFESWIKHLETNKLNNLDEAPSLLEHFGKYRSLMPSLALIFHLLEIADSNRSGNVSLQATQQAAQWCEYLEKHARRIYGMAEDITARAAGSLSKKIKNGNLEDNFTAREVHRKGWELLTEIETVNAALTDLVEANWLREIPILPTEKGGRKTMNYQINPEIKKSEIL